VLHLAAEEEQIGKIAGRNPQPPTNLRPLLRRLAIRTTSSGRVAAKPYLTNPKWDVPHDLQR
jgi:hypothetical protein